MRSQDLPYKAHHTLIIMKFVIKQWQMMPTILLYTVNCWELVQCMYSRKIISVWNLGLDYNYMYSMYSTVNQCSNSYPSKKLLCDIICKITKDPWYFFLQYLFTLLFVINILSTGNDNKWTCTCEILHLTYHRHWVPIKSNSVINNLLICRIWTVLTVLFNFCYWLLYYR